MKKNLTCIICPLGCSLMAEIENGKVISVYGNSCKRGYIYAETECISPMRTLTTTVLTTDGRLLSCKSDRPIPKSTILEAMKIINSSKTDLPKRVGDVIIEDVFGARIIATENLD